MEANLRQKQLYYLVEEAEQRASDRCWISSSLHGRHQNFQPPLEARHWRLETEGSSEICLKSDTLNITKYSFMVHT